MLTQNSVDSELKKTMAVKVKKQKPKFNVNWLIILSYLTLILLLPGGALITKSFSLGFEEFWRVATSKIAISAYNVTFFTALCAGVINGIMGTLIAWVLVRYDFPGKKIIDGAIDLPFALPTSVAGLVLATVYSDQGILGKFFGIFGVKIAFTRLGVFVAMLFISLPFVVRTLQPVLQEMEREVEEAAACLGATEFQTFTKVILPPLIPPILTGVALGFSRAVGEYGSVVLVASNIPFQDLIAPVLVFQYLEEYNYAGATVIGTILLLFALFSLLAINILQQWSRRYAIQ